MLGDVLQPCHLQPLEAHSKGLPWCLVDAAGASEGLSDHHEGRGVPRLLDDLASCSSLRS